MIRYLYTTYTSPPAPFVNVDVMDPSTGTIVRTIPAQLVTGADRTLLPQVLLDRLGATPIGSLVLQGFAGLTMPAGIYLVDVVLPGNNVIRVEVSVGFDESWILIGRDILNQCRVFLDGPALALEIG